MSEAEWTAEGRLSLPLFGEQFTNVGEEALDLFLQPFELKRVRLSVKVEVLDE